MFRVFLGGHPKVQYLLSYLVQLGGIASWFFQMYTTAKFVNGGKVDLPSLLVGSMVNIVEIAAWFIIFCKIAPRVTGILSQWGLKPSSVKLERLIDSVVFAFLIYVYICDAYATFIGCPQTWSDTTCFVIALIQLPLFEMLLSVGAWMRDESAVNTAAVEKAKEPAELTKLTLVPESI